MTTRITKDDWSILATEHIIGHKAVSRYDIGYLFPLYLYNAAENKKPNQNQNNHLFVKEPQAQYNERRENFAPEFRAFIDQKYGHHYEPEEILGYIYAVLHSPTYRRKYAEFLKIDFPRIPFVDDRQTFEKLSALGWQLVQAHLLKEIPPSPRSRLPRAATWWKSQSITPRNSGFISTPSSISRRCRKMSGTSISAAIRFWTNT